MPYRTRVVSAAVAAVLFLVSIGRGQAAETIVLDSANVMMPLARALAEAFQERNPGITVQLGKGLGGRDRLEALEEGRIDVELGAHGLKLEPGLKSTRIARVPVVIAVNSAVTLEGLTGGQLCAIYAGKITNWRELGGPDLPIALQSRPEEQTDISVVRREIACMAEVEMLDSTRIAPKVRDMARALASTPGAIGMAMLLVIERTDGRARPVSVNGVRPSPENVRSGAYPLSRDWFFITKAAPSAAVAKFIDFVRSADGEKVLRAHGAIPVE